MFQHERLEPDDPAAADPFAALAPSLAEAVQPATADFHRRYAKMLDAATAAIEELRQLAQHQPDRQREAMERMLAPTILRLQDALELDD